MIVVGLDLSLTSTGIARVTTWDHPDAQPEVELDRVTSTGKATASWDDRGDRLADLSATIHAEVARRSALDLVVVEGPAYSKSLPGAFDRAGLWWSVYLALRGDGIPIAVVDPMARAKYATGKGNAGKDEVLLAVARRWWNVGAQVDGNDQADALVLASMGADHLGRPLVDVPQTHRDALTKVAWP